MTTLTHSSVSGAYAEPQTIIGRGKQTSPVHVTSGTLEAATSDIDNADIIHLCRIPWTAKVHSIVLYNDALDTHSTPTLAVGVGIYSVTKAGVFTAQSATAYASAATTLRAANTLGVQVAFQNRDIIKLGVNNVILDAGLTVPVAGQDAVISITVSAGAATAAAGSISYRVEYTQ